MWMGEAWSACKAGVEGLARSAAATYAPKGLRINCVAPGFTEDAASQGERRREQAVLLLLCALHRLTLTLRKCMPQSEAFAKQQHRCVSF